MNYQHLLVVSITLKHLCKWSKVFWRVVLCSNAECSSLFEPLSIQSRVVKIVNREPFGDLFLMEGVWGKTLLLLFKQKKAARVKDIHGLDRRVSHKEYFVSWKPLALPSIYVLRQNLSQFQFDPPISLTASYQNLNSISFPSHLKSMESSWFAPLLFGWSRM